MSRTPQPLFFGGAEPPLFGCYHPPRTAGGCGRGVVLCYPHGQEYIRSHRAFLRLADALTFAGFPVLRFDYYGTGDSLGESGEGGPDRWSADVGAAIDELVSRSGVGAVSLVGLRLGAALAIVSAAGRADVDAIVAWNPVVRGDSYLEELVVAQARMLREAYVERRGDDDEELLGFPVPATLRDALSAVNPLSISRRPARRALIVEHDPIDGAADLERLLGELGSRVERRSVSDPKIWNEDPYKGLVPRQTLDAIVAWIEAR